LIKIVYFIMGFVKDNLIDILNEEIEKQEKIKFDKIFKNYFYTTFNYGITKTFNRLYISI